MFSGFCISTFTLHQEVSPEADDGRLFVQLLLLLRQSDGEKLTEGLGS